MTEQVGFALPLVETAFFGRKWDRKRQWGGEGGEVGNQFIFKKIRHLGLMGFHQGPTAIPTVSPFIHLLATWAIRGDPLNGILMSQYHLRACLHLKTESCLNTTNLELHLLTQCWWSCLTSQCRRKQIIILCISITSAAFNYNSLTQFGLISTDQL